MEYLEAAYPEPPMRPADAFEAAQLTGLVRFADLYLGPAMFPIAWPVCPSRRPGGIAAALYRPRKLH